MFRRTMHPLIGIVLFLGAFGLVYTLFAQPLLFLRRIIFIGLAVAIVYAIYQWGYRRRINKERAAYLKAVNQSKKMQAIRERKPQAKVSHSKKGTHHRLPKKRTTSHLTVIEGKKGKKKNRALF
ncbi:SA1362 family protein [Anoxybacteroides tepidamans]|uniref:SA1362 family protein n=1 Tax=Anoxybacteroides tepidamans TaxID=265948 RepID=UPI000480D16E|nr:SA1362 family protein [Anoxybacillus tepidamans]